MKIKDAEVTLPAISGQVAIKRMTDGFPALRAEEKTDVFYGLGYVHGHDRQMHMWLLKIITQGRGSEVIAADDTLIELDKYMRWINLPADTATEIKKLSPQHADLLDVYCRGVNQAVADTGRPLEFKLIGYHPDPWTPEDCLNMAKVIGFMGLTQGIGDMEKFIIEMIQNNIEPAKIKELFPSIEEEISAELIDVIKKIKLMRPNIPDALPWLAGKPAYAASNNWALGPQRTASGKPILCGDPHLAIQLPSIWYNSLLEWKDRYVMGATIPGVPVLAVARTPDLAWAVTYSPADISDYFIEEIRDGKYRREDEWRSFEVREEIIRPKKKEPIAFKVYENEHGLLEGDAAEDGFFLSYAWTGRLGTVAASLSNFLNLFELQNVSQALDCFAGLTFAPFNWVCADAKGNIGYQMSGLIPVRKPGQSGLLPFLGWDPAQDWTGLEDPHRNPRVMNPPEGFIVTANQDLNHLGEIKPIKFPMPSYRADRIADLLTAHEELTIAHMKTMHYDLYSIQAEAFMALIKPLLPDTENGKILSEWDLCYDRDSLGATLFERIYGALVNIVFGEIGLGEQVLQHFITETPLFALLHGFFDRILLQDKSIWYGDFSREQIYQRAIANGLKDPAVPYGQTRQVYFNNLFFGGRLPKFLGFDYGPYALIGSRATIPQGQIFKAMGQTSTFAPSYRMITDFAEPIIEANVAGGPSDRRFSKYYTMGLKDWMGGTYHVLRPQSASEK